MINDLDMTVSETNFEDIKDRKSSISLKVQNALTTALCSGLVICSLNSCSPKADTVSEVRLGVTDVGSFPGLPEFSYQGIVCDAFDVAPTSASSRLGHYDIHAKSIHFQGKDYELVKVTRDSLVLRYHNN